MPSPTLSVRFLTRLAALGLALLATACASYQPGAGAPPPFRSIAVAPVRVETLVPQAGALLQRQVSTSLAGTAGGVPLVDESGADAVLEITLVDARRTRRATRADDSARGLTYDVELVALVTLRAADGRLLIDRERVSVADPALTFGDLPESEHQLLPVLGERLAARIRSVVYDRW